MSHSFKHHLIWKDHGLGRGCKALANRTYRRQMCRGKFDCFGGKSNKYRCAFNSYNIHDYVFRYRDANRTDLHDPDLRAVKCK